MPVCTFLHVDAHRKSLAFFLRKHLCLIKHNIFILLETLGLIIIMVFNMKHVPSSFRSKGDKKALRFLLVAAFIGCQKPRKTTMRKTANLKKTSDRTRDLDSNLNELVGS